MRKRNLSRRSPTEVQQLSWRTIPQRIQRVHNLVTLLRQQDASYTVAEFLNAAVDSYASYLLHELGLTDEDVAHAVKPAVHTTKLDESAETRQFNADEVATRTLASTARVRARLTKNNKKA